MESFTFSDKAFVLHRANRKNDFRASGSGIFTFKENIPDGLLDFANKVFLTFNVPNLSLDIAYDSKQFYLIEYQALYFGTTTIQKAPFFFHIDNNIWKLVKEKANLEKEYVNSIVRYISLNYSN